MGVKREKAVFNWSGGKDSALALYYAKCSGQYDIMALLTTVNQDNGRSLMHAIPAALLQAQADSIGLPLHIVELDPKADMEEYESAMNCAVGHFKGQGITKFIFGDIFLEDIRAYREQNLAKYRIDVVEPLWGKSSAEVLNDFAESGFRTVIVTTMADRLDHSFIGCVIDRSFMPDFPEGVDLCGENGEYHTFCFDGPIFREPIPYCLGEPFLFSNEVTSEDGSKTTFSYWFAHIQ